MQPLLSIVIPTKNRYKYLKHFISYLYALKNDRLEVVIHDNTENNTEILEFLKNLCFPLLKYYHHAEHLTINDNSDLAILKSSGKYVCYMGDDDLVLPNIMDAVEIMERIEVDAITCSRPMYMWPDTKGSLLWNCVFPYTIPKASSVVEIIDSTSEIKKVLKSGGVNLGKLPRVYHGIVSRVRLNQLYEKTNTFFPGPSPDMANAMALACIGASCCYVDYPFIIAGTSQARIAGNEKKGDKQKNLQSLVFLDANTEKYWESKIPKIWTNATIYAETAIKVLRRFSQYDKYSQDMNFSAFYLEFLLAFKEEYRIVLSKASFLELAKLLLLLSIRGFRKICKLLFHRPSPATVLNQEYPNVSDFAKSIYRLIGPFVK